MMLLVLCSAAFADGVGTWKTHLSYNAVEKVVVADKDIYVLSHGNLYSVNPHDNSLTTYTKAEGMNDNNIVDIEWSKVARRLVVAYRNSNIDVLSPDGDVVNIPDLYLKTMTGKKDIHHITMSGRYAYLTTSFGIIKLDVSNLLIADSYDLKQSVQDLCICGKYIFATLDDYSVLRADASSNLHDPANWKPFQAFAYNYHYGLGDNMLFLLDGFVHSINIETSELTSLGSQGVSWATLQDDTVIFGSGDTFYTIDAKLQMKQYRIPGITITNARAAGKNIFWANDNDGRLVRYTFDDNGEVTARTTGVGPDGPKTQIYRLDLSGNKLYAVSGIYSKKYVVNTDAEVMVYDGEKWSTFENGIAAATGHRYRNLDFVVVDPTNSHRVIAGGETGLYEFIDGKMSNHWNCTNAPLPSTQPGNSTPQNWNIVNSACFDKDGNLWVMASMSQAVLCLTKDGKWISFPHPDLMSDNYARLIENSFVDKNGILWFISTNDYDARVFRYDIAADKLSRLEKIINQDGTSYLTFFYNLQKDIKGNIWIATQDGPFYISAEDARNDIMEVTQHKVPRNDGTNLADYLLAGISISCITVDAANRKWFGTHNNGVYVISSDNNTEILHLTAETSQLLSNSIYDIKIDEATGVVYISTDAGLCAYQSDLTTNKEGMTDSNVWAYPNPVTPNYTGMIAIRGLDYDSQVTITTAAGTLVNEGTCSAGTYMWDGRDMQGRRVASGVYMVCVATAEGSKGVVAKVAIVR